jgi:hypothetical protein
LCAESQAIVKADAEPALSLVIVYAVVDDALSPDFPLGDTLEVFVRLRGRWAVHRAGARRRSRDRGEARIEERELEVGRMK